MGALRNQLLVLPRAKHETFRLRYNFSSTWCSFVLLIGYGIFTKGSYCIAAKTKSYKDWEAMYFRDSNFFAILNKKRMNFSLNIIFLALLVSHIASCKQETSDFITDPEYGVTFDLAKHRKENIDEVEYDLRIKIPGEVDEALTGENTISFILATDDLPVVLDFKVEEAKVLGIEIDAREVPIIFKKGHLLIDKQYLKKGRNKLLVKFEVGDQSLNRQDDFLYTLLVPDRASTAFPCFDQPNLKAKYKLTLDIPKDWEALANGKLKTMEELDSTKVLTFAETEPLPSYLFDFVAGDFQKVTKVVNGREMSMLHRESDTASVNRNMDKIFALHGSSIAWLEEYTEIKMPFQKFDFALIPSFQYGGMEHPGAITYKASSLFLNENPTQNQELGRASLIAHETAHMWFGNLVTMDWFSDVWMKEVFANFMAAKMVNPSFPDINHDLRFTLSHYPGAYSVDRTRGSHAIQQDLTNLKDAGSLYGSIIYQKAPIVMRMLEREIGASVMQEGLRDYLAKFSYSNATWDQLIEILDAKSPVNLADWNRQWIKQAGMPHVLISYEGSKGGSSGKLLAHLSDQTKGNWWQTLTVATIGRESVSRHRLKIADKANVLEVEARQKPLAIIPNGDGYGYGFFEVDDTSIQYLLANINNLEDSMLRGVSWLNLWEHMLNQKVPPREILRPLMQGIAIETDPLIRQRILSYIDELYWVFLSPEDQKALSTELEDVLWSALQDSNDSRAKRAIFNAYRSVATSGDALSNLLKIWRNDLAIDGVSFSEDDYISLAFHLAIREIANSKEVLDQQLKRLENKDRRSKMTFIAPALSPDQSVRDQFFESLEKVENRNTESWVQEAIAWLNHPLRVELSQKYVLPTLELLEELQQTGDIFFPKRVLDNTFRGYNTREVVSVVKSFLNARPDYPMSLKNKILQASDNTFRASSILSNPE